MTAPDDDALMARVVQGDRSAFATLVARHLNPVHRYLSRLSGSPTDADDLSQETFLRVWQRAGSYRPGTVAFTTWLHRVAHNLAVDAARRHREETGTPLELIADEQAGPDGRAEHAQSVAQLDAAIAALPPNQRAALLLCQVQGFSNRDAAAIVGVSVRSLESLVARARRSLRERVLASGRPADHPSTGSDDHDSV